MAAHGNISKCSMMCTFRRRRLYAPPRILRAGWKRAERCMPSRVLLLIPCPAKVVALPKVPAAVVAFSTFVFVSAGLGPGLFGGDGDHSRVKVCAIYCSENDGRPRRAFKGKRKNCVVWGASMDERNGNALDGVLFCAWDKYTANLRFERADCPSYPLLYPLSRLSLPYPSV